MTTKKQTARRSTPTLIPLYDFRSKTHDPPHDAMRRLVYGERGRGVVAKALGRFGHGGLVFAYVVQAGYTRPRWYLGAAFVDSRFDLARSESYTRADRPFMMRASGGLETSSETVAERWITNVRSGNVVVGEPSDGVRVAVSTRRRVGSTKRP